MCHGDLAFEFFDRGGRLTAAVGLHHANYLRWSGWDGDALLRDGARYCAGSLRRGLKVRWRRRNSANENATSSGSRSSAGGPLRPPRYVISWMWQWPLAAPTEYFRRIYTGWWPSALQRRFRIRSKGLAPCLPGMAPERGAAASDVHGNTVGETIIRAYQLS